MALKVVNNEFAERIELTPESAEFYFKQQSEKIKALWSDNGMIDLGGGIWLNMNSNYIPNYQDVIRRFISRSGNQFIDKINGNDADIWGLASVFGGVDGTIKSVETYAPVGLFIFEGYFCFTSVSVLQTLYNSNCGNFGFNIAIQTDGRLRVTKAGASVVFYSSMSLSSNIMYHIRYNYNIVTGVIELYIDGVLDATATTTETFTFSNFCVGAEGAIRFLNAKTKGIKLTYDSFILNITYPHLAVGIDANNNPIALIVAGGVTAGYDEAGSLHLQNYGGVVKADGSIIPNGFDGQPLYTLEATDTFIAGSLSKLNTLPSKIVLFETGDTEAEKICMDKSNTDYWKVAIQSLLNYDSANTGLWDISELTTEFFFEYASGAFKYSLWSKIESNFLTDLFLYSAPLTPANVYKAKTYVGVGEGYTEADYANVQIVHPLDYTVYE